MRLLACFVTLLLLSTPAWTQGWSIPNTEGSFQSFQNLHGYDTWNGACYGMVRAHVLAARMGQGEQFSRATVPRDRGDHLFLVTVAYQFQGRIFEDRQWAPKIFAQKAPPARVDSTLASSQPTRDNPQIMVLTGNSGHNQSHAVAIVGRRDHGKDVYYEVADPNKDTVSLLRYDKASGKFDDYDGYSGFIHDQTEFEPNLNRELEAMVEGIPQRRVPITVPDKREGLVITPPPPPSQPSPPVSQGARSYRDDAVGGVRLAFDPTLTIEQVNSLAPTLTRDWRQGKSSTLVRAGGKKQLLRVELTEASENLGLTHLHGYLKEGDRFYLLGTRKAGAKPIPTRWLSFALKVVWKQGRQPAISLDPQTRVPYGSQKLRLVDLLSTDRDTDFVRVMVEADYAMKRIVLGDDPVPGTFEDSLAQLYAEEGIAAADHGYERFWLEPKETPGASVYVTRSQGSELVYFDSDIILNTERMKNARLLTSSASSPHSLRAARSFSRAYPQLEVARPIFGELRGIFACAKLATVVRLTGLSHPDLEQLSSRSWPAVPVATSYEGVGPLPIRGSKLLLGGGTLATPDISSHDLVEVPNLARRLESSIEIALPASVPLSQAGSVRLRLSQVRNSLLSGQIEPALAELEELLSLRPGDQEALLWRARANFFKGRYQDALNDLAGLPENPHMLGFRGLFRAYTGDLSGGLDDLRKATAAAPTDLGLLAQKTKVEIHALELDAAAKDLDALLAADPLNQQHKSLSESLQTMRELPPSVARQYLDQETSIPIVLALKLQAINRSAGRNGHSAALEELSKLQSSLPPEASVAQEKCELMRSSLLVSRDQPGDTEAALVIYDELIETHPEWVSPWLLKFDLLWKSDPLAATQAYLKAAAGSTANDPLMVSLNVEAGSDRITAAGWGKVFKAMRDGGPGSNEQEKALLPLLESVEKRLQAGGAARNLCRIVGVFLGREPETLAKLEKQSKAGPKPGMPEPVMQLFLEALDSSSLGPSATVHDIQAFGFLALFQMQMKDGQQVNRMQKALARLNGPWNGGRALAASAHSVALYFAWATTHPLARAPLPEMLVAAEETMKPLANSRFQSEFGAGVLVLKAWEQDQPSQELKAWFAEHARTLVEAASTDNERYLAVGRLSELIALLGSSSEDAALMRKLALLSAQVAP